MIGRRALGSCAFVALLVPGLLALPAAAGEECEASIRAELAGERPAGRDTRYTWRVELTTTAPCASVAFILVTEEERPDGEVWVTRTPKRTKLASGTASIKVGYRVREGNTLIAWTFEVTGCKTCDWP